MLSLYLKAISRTKEPLKLLLHFSVSVLIIVSILASIIFVVIADFDLHNNAFFTHSYGYVPYFFSYWVSTCQVIYFHIFSIIDIIDLFGKDSIKLCKIRNQLPNIANYLLYTLVFPLSLTVFTVFWGIYLYDREYIYPKLMDEFYPTWLNHVMHTVPVPLSAVYMVLASRKEPPMKNTLTGLSLFLGIYAACIIRLKLKYGHWVYPVLNSMTPRLVKYVLAFTAIISYIYLFLGYYLNKKINGQSAISIAGLSSLKYENVLSAHCPVLENEKRRLQIIFIRTIEPESPLIQLKELLRGQHGKKVNVFFKKSSAKPHQVIEDFEKSNSISICKEKHSGRLSAIGCNFLLKHIRDEAYMLENGLSNEVIFLNQVFKLYPYILVIFEEEVVFMMVTSADKYELLGTSSLNIHNLLNLAKPLFRPNDAERTISLAKLFIASSPGENLIKDCLESSMSEDIEIQEMSTAFGLLNMFCKNIAQMSTLYAKMNGISQVIFGENISDDVIIKKILANSIENLSEGCIHAVFLRHENFLSGIGAMLSSVPEFEKSWHENYCESTGMTFQFCFFEGIQTQQLTLDSLNESQLVCPLLLQPDLYCPDTQNLNEDIVAREYWVKCIKNGVAQGTERRISGMSDAKAIKGLRLYKDLVLERMDYLYANPNAYGELSMRILQDTLEHMKRETGLITMYEKRKENENNCALEELPDILKYIDLLGHCERQEELITAMMAGNMFDWGAGEVTKLMRQGNFGFMQAREKLSERPWLIDDLDQWTKRTCEGPFKQAMVFCDNSGYDLILGIIPFVRDLLQRGTKVVICVNKDPVINDVTYYGLKEVLQRVKLICPIIKESLEQQRLITMEISKSTCCLDLSFIDASIAEKMTEVDLLVIEGMGRAVHTNLNASFNCETLRIAVIKDRWLSEQHGGHNFACICKYTL